MVVLIGRREACLESSSCTEIQAALRQKSSRRVSSCPPNNEAPGRLVESLHSPLRIGVPSAFAGVVPETVPIELKR